MLLRAAALIAALMCAVTARAQTGVPTIRAHARIVTVTDGLHLKKNYWYIMPERSPDIYYVEIPLQPHTVTFTTDVESISFPVAYGSRHAFVIRLDDGVEARTEVRADFKHLLRCQRSPNESTATSIPFRLGDNDKIYVTGSLNGGPLLDLQFDLGAGGSLVKKASVPKANMTFDGTITLRNSDGENVVPSSSANRLTIGDCTWEHVPVAVADNMTRREDGLIGNALFQDKVVEIDYGRRVIVIHDTLPALTADWRRHDLVLDGGVVPFVRGTLSVGGSPRSGWFMLDTGAYTSILNSDRLSTVSKLGGELRRFAGLGAADRGPALTVGGHTFSETNFSVRPYDGDPNALGLLGNDILQRFDLILDNRSGAAYFRPNAHLSDPFRNPERTLVRGVAVTIVLVIAAVWRFRRRRRFAAPPAQ